MAVFDSSVDEINNKHMPITTQGTDEHTLYLELTGPLGDPSLGEC